MARRLPRLVLSAAALWFAPMLHADDAMPIAHYAFEAGEALDTGPDSFAVFEPAHGDVTLTAAFRVSGRRAVLLHDVPGDGDFPELQGYFPLRTDGVLSIRFALMTPDPAMPWNVALAGPEGFMLRPGGIAFWLEAEDGVLRHVSDSIPKRLLSLRSFVWYFIDVRYDVAAGSYDLTIREESREAPLIDLRRQPGASAAIASPIDKFSFVGDVEHDAHASDLFVDDISLALSPATPLPPIVAPGRRALFVDEWLRTLRADNVADENERLFIDAIQRSDFSGAQNVALDQIRRHDRDATWTERAGDAAYLLGDRVNALRRYVAATELDPSRVLAWLKRADMHHLFGEVDAERRCRERIYGALHE
ncbi:MAG: hypothetical protein U0V87_13435 [Acidobacteriota bacterium]